MKHSPHMLTKARAFLLSLIMLIGTLPMTAFVAEAETVTNGGMFANSKLSVASNKQSTLAQGVQENLYTVYNKNGEQIKMYATTIDLSVDSVKMFTSYKGMDNSSFGMSKLTEQVEAFNQKAASGDSYYQGTVVAGINASYYNMNTGKPAGAFVMNGNDVTSEAEGNAYGYFAIMKDGTVKIGNKGDYSKDKGNIQEAFGIHTMLIVDGQICSGLDDAAKYPRQTIGITADNKVIVLSADGNQAPASVGLTLLEQAQAMYDIGCVWAGHLDGGGSMTHGIRAEGKSEFKVVNSPSDGSERSVSNGFIIVSTAVSDGIFNHAVISVDHEYITPGSSVSVTALGADKSGATAVIPENALLSATNGSIIDGKFVSDGTTGDAVISMTVDGKTVGTATVHVVVPDSIKFNQTAITVPYGKTTSFSVSAYYGIYKVEILDSDFSFSLEENSIGKLNGTIFEATTDNTISGGKIKATLICDSSVTASVPVVLGKGSEILYTFENGFDDDWYVEHFQYRKAFANRYLYPEVANFNFILESYAVTPENGMVHSGNGAGAIYSDTTYGTNNWPGAYITWAGEEKTYENATRIGAWVYHPKDAVSAQVTFALTVVKNGVESKKQLSASNYGDSTKYEESGWHYYSVDVSEYDAIILKKSTPTPKTSDDIGKFARWDGFAIEIRIQLNGGESGDYSWKTEPGVKGQNTFYVDDVIIDFSDSCDDREAPVFGDVYMEDTKLNNQRQSTTTVSGNGFAFCAYVEEDMTRVNASGLNAATAKAYIDGQEIKCSFDGSNIGTPVLYLSNGVHTIKFVIYDNAGNYASVIRKVNVSGADADADVSIVPKTDKTLIFTGSQYWIDIIAKNIENVEKVTVALDLNNTNTWLAEHIETLNGFTATYSKDVAGENTLYLTLERTGTVYSTGETVIASVPIQTWEWNEDDYPGYDPSFTTDGDLNNNHMYDPYEFWQAHLTHNFDVIVNPLSGKVIFIDSTEKWFSGETIKVDTEQQIGVWTGQGWDDATTGYIATYFGGKSSWHLHSAGAPQDKAATCTEAGYIGRVFCTGCSCVTESELGHKCDSTEGCGAVLEWGTTIPATGGHSYELVDGQFVCSECEDVYEPGTGLFEMNGNRYYAINNKLVMGWFMIDETWYYFGSNYAAYVGEKSVDGRAYIFDEIGKITGGQWFIVDGYTRYYFGPEYTHASGGANLTLKTIGDNVYGFDRNGNKITGVFAGYLSYSLPITLYRFDDNGIFLGEGPEKDGFVKCQDGIRYYKDGRMLSGLNVIDQKYYYFSVHDGLMRTGEYTVNSANSNGLFDKDMTFHFNENTGAAEIEKDTGFKVENGNTYYYLSDGSKAVGLHLIEGKYYYFSIHTAVMRTGEYTVNPANSNGMFDKDMTFHFDMTNGYAVDKNGEPLTTLN